MELGTLVLTGDHQPRWEMGDPHRRISGIHALPAVPGGTVDVDAELVGVNFDLDIVNLRQNGYRRRGSVNTPAGLGGRHALHAVYPAFVLEPGVCTVPFHLEDNLLVAADADLVLANDGRLPLMVLRMFHVHPG